MANKIAYLLTDKCDLCGRPLILVDWLMPDSSLSTYYAIDCLGYLDRYFSWQQKGLSSCNGCTLEDRPKHSAMELEVMRLVCPIISADVESG